MHVKKLKTKIKKGASAPLSPACGRP